MRFIPFLLIGVGAVYFAHKQPSTVTVQNDGGGSIARYAGQALAWQANGTHPRLTGDYCASACTMYLSIAKCVGPDTVLAFHGPSSATKGLGLSPATFEDASMTMADHYPDPLRAWFIAEGRYIIDGFTNFSGQELIDMGVAKSC